MKDLKELEKLFKENLKLIVTTLVAMVIGAILGVMAFYNGWLDNNNLRFSNLKVRDIMTKWLDSIRKPNKDIKTSKKII